VITVTDVSKQLAGLIFMGQAVQEDCLDCLNFEDGTDRLSRNIGHNYQIYFVSRSRRGGLNCGGSLKSRKVVWIVDMLVTT
jgi:hypothetical protein